MAKSEVTHSFNNAKHKVMEIGINSFNATENVILCDPFK